MFMNFCVFTVKYLVIVFLEKNRLDMMSTILHVLKEYLEFLKRISIIGQIPLKYSLLLVHVWYDSLILFLFVTVSYLCLVMAWLSEILMNVWRFMAQHRQPIYLFPPLVIFFSGILQS